MISYHLHLISTTNANSSNQKELHFLNKLFNEWTVAFLWHSSIIWIHTTNQITLFVACWSSLSWVHFRKTELRWSNKCYKIRIRNMFPSHGYINRFIKYFFFRYKNRQRYWPGSMVRSRSSTMALFTEKLNSFLLFSKSKRLAACCQVSYGHHIFIDHFRWRLSTAE